MANFFPSSNGSSSLNKTRLGSDTAIESKLLCTSSGTKLYRNIKSAGIVRNSSGSMRCSLKSTKAQRYLPASLRANSCSLTASEPSPGTQLCSCVATVSLTLLYFAGEPEREKEKIGK